MVLLRKHSGGAAIFAAGTRVEVHHKREGSKGAWYEATVTRVISHRPHLDVVFSTLVSDDDPSQPLRETVLCSSVRPRPPRFGAGPGGWGLHQLVEVYSKDGWRVGVVADVGGGGTYSVIFADSREVVEFPASDIRPRFIWRDDQWFASEDGDQEGAKFGVGKQVEVSGDTDNYGVTWFPGTIVKVIDKVTFLVKYDKPQEDGTTNLVGEILDAQYVRPVPPPTPQNTVFDLLEEIEVWHCRGWMAGVVSKIVDDSNYLVKLKCGKEEIQLNRSNMRTFRSWKYGQWKLSRKEWAKFRVGNQVEVFGNTENYGVAWFPGTVVKVIDKTTFLVEYNRPQEDGRTNFVGEVLDAQYIRPVTQPILKSKEFYLLEEIEVCHHGMWMAGVVSKVVDDSNYVIKLKNGEEIQLNLSDMRTIRYWKNGRWTWSRKRRRRCQLPIPFSPSSPCDIEQTSKINLKCKMGDKGSCEGQVEALQPRMKLSKDVPVTPVMEIEVFASSEGFKTTPPNELVTGSCSGKVGSEEDLSIDELSEDPNLHTFSSTSVLVVRGEKSLNSKGDGSEHSEREVLSTNQGFGNPPNELVTGSFHGEAGLEENLSLDELSEGPCMRKSSSTSELIARGDESSKSKGSGSERSIVNHLLSKHETDHDSVLAPDRRNFANGNEMFAINRRCEDDPKIIDARYHSNAEMKKDMPLKESATNISSMNVSSPSESSSVKTLPFKKKSKMWDIVNSMEVFHKMPQDPCFRKLELCSINLREGVAIGLMVSFANLADSVSKMCISDPQSAFEEKLEDLKRFEENGFDVLRIRERIEELLEIRNILNLIEKEKAKLEYQVSEGEKENERSGALEEEIDRTIKEVEQELACLYEKRNSINVQRSKLSSLQKDLQAAKESCQSEKDSFERICYSPW